MSWSAVLNTPKKVINKKLDWYHKRRDQRELDEFLEEDNE